MVKKTEELVLEMFIHHHILFVCNDKKELTGRWQEKISLVDGESSEVSESSDGQGGVGNSEK